MALDLFGGKMLCEKLIVESDYQLLIGIWSEANNLKLGQMASSTLCKIAYLV